MRLREGQYPYLSSLEQGFFITSFLLRPKNLIQAIFIVFLGFIAANKAVGRPLPDLMILALNNHPTIKSAKAQRKVAEQTKKSASWQFYPTPSIGFQTAMATGENPNFQGDAMVFVLGIEQPIYQGGKRFADVDKAKLDIDIADIKLIKKQQDIAFELLDAYSEWLSAYYKLEAYEESLAEHERLLHRVENRANVGVSNRGDIDLALSRYESTKAQTIQTEFKASSALSTIIEIINQPVTSDSLAQTIAQPISQTEKLPVLLERTLANHPDMLIARKQAEKSKADITINKSSLWPDVYVKVEQQIGNFAIKGAAPSTTLLVGVRSQLGAGLSSFSDIKASRHEVESSEMEIEARQRQLKQQTVESHILENSLRTQMKATEVTLQAAEKVFDSYSRQFLAGRKSWLDLMNSLREMTADKVEHADLYGSLLRTSIRREININGLGAYLSKAAKGNSTGNRRPINRSTPAKGKSSS